MVDKTVFIITYGRSGSTLLQNMINAFPGYIIRGENNNILLHLVRSWHDLYVFHPQKIARMKTNTLPCDPWFGYEIIDPDHFGKELAGVFMRQVLRVPPNTRVAGFKEIRWHQEPELFTPTLEFLRRYMPEARFVFNTRNHADVCHSGWWRKWPEDLVRKQLEGAESLYLAWRNAHPECSLAMHYDDYTRSVEAWSPLFEFLNVPFQGQLVKQILDHKLTHMKGQGR